MTFVSVLADHANETFWSARAELQKTVQSAVIVVKPMRPARERARLLFNNFLIMPGFKAQSLPAPFEAPFMKAFSREQTRPGALQNARKEVK
jgi:hypothetical protein